VQTDAGRAWRSPDLRPSPQSRTDQAQPRPKAPMSGDDVSGAGRGTRGIPATMRGSPSLRAVPDPPGSRPPAEVRCVRRGSGRRAFRPARSGPDQAMIQVRQNRAAKNAPDVTVTATTSRCWSRRFSAEGDMAGDWLDPAPSIPLPGSVCDGAIGLTRYEGRACRPPATPARGPIEARRTGHAPARSARRGATAVRPRRCRPRRGWIPDRPPARPADPARP
jgi:hypothetical protein